MILDVRESLIDRTISLISQIEIVTNFLIVYQRSWSDQRLAVRLVSSGLCPLVQLDEMDGAQYRRPS